MAARHGSGEQRAGDLTTTQRTAVLNTDVGVVITQTHQSNFLLVKPPCTPVNLPQTTPPPPSPASEGTCSPCVPHTGSWW
jgi:hypothetical protein